jgi:hypothetical protein
MLNSILRCMPAPQADAELVLERLSLLILSILHQGVVFQELCQVEEHRLLHLKAILRAFNLREINLVSLCGGMMQEPRVVSDRMKSDSKVCRCMSARSVPCFLSKYG